MLSPSGRFLPDLGPPTARVRASFRREQEIGCSARSSRRAAAHIGIGSGIAKVPPPTPAKTRPGGEDPMNRTTLAAITLVSALATPVAVNATAPKANPIVAGTGIAATKAQEPTCV